ncbi:HLA class II histocompatibility antigen, DRB1-8 beta chain, partial [Poecilia reticulata]
SVLVPDGFREFGVTRCVFNSSELKDIQFIRSYCYNKLEFIRFDSNVGKFVGYTELGVKNAEIWNSNPSQIASERALRETYCLHNVGIDYQTALDKSVAPTVKLHSRTPPAGHHPSMLVCRVYDFYPKTIKVRWLRDGQEVTSDVTTTDEMEDGDWYYQVHSTLEYTPRWVRTR